MSRGKISRWTHSTILPQDHFQPAPTVISLVEPPLPDLHLLPIQWNLPHDLDDPFHIALFIQQLLKCLRDVHISLWLFRLRQDLFFRLKTPQPDPLSSPYPSTPPCRSCMALPSFPSEIVVIPPPSFISPRSHIRHPRGDIDPSRRRRLISVQCVSRFDRSFTRRLLGRFRGYLLDSRTSGRSGLSDCE